MHKARVFVLICLGVFMLSVAYHLGATVALSQSSDTVTAVDYLNPSRFLGTAAGDVYIQTGDPTSPTWTLMGNVGAPVSYIHNTAGSNLDLYTPSGDFYWSMNS